LQLATSALALASGALRKDRLERKARIREILDWPLPRSVITKVVGDAITGYCDDMLSDATCEIGSELQRDKPLYGLPKPSGQPTSGS
jgi:hypothetical protein